MATSLSGVIPAFRRVDSTSGRRTAVRALTAERLRSLALGEGLFKDALVRERRRADRFGQPFAVLLVDRGRAFPDGDRWTPILGALAAAKRDIDVVGWIERGTVLGLLLPEVPEGRLALGLLHQVQREMARRVGEAAVAALSFRLYAHGGDGWPEGATPASVDDLLEAFVPAPRRPWRDAAKRGLDIVGSLALLALFAPLYLAIFLAVKWSSPGPALYRQERIGRRGQRFKMLKFRSMYVDAGHAIHQEYVTWFIKSSGTQPRNGDEVFKLTNDPRVTGVGRFLRKTSLDELPQFWNVLRGELSLVGPRPPLPFEVEQYQPWHLRRVFDAKPGVTGLWQVTGRSRTTFDEMVRLDLRYARTHSVWTDLRILAATPRAMISGKGAC